MSSSVSLLDLGKPKLFMTDIDGTVLDNTPDNITHLSALSAVLLREKVLFSYNTARSFWRTKNILPGICTTAPSVFSMGSECRNKDGSLLYIEYIKKNGHQSVIECLSQIICLSILSYINGSLHPIVFAQTHESLLILAKNYGAMQEDLYSNKGDFLKRLARERISSTVVRYDEKDQEIVVHHLMKATQMLQCHSINVGTCILTAREVDKAYGMRKVVEILNLSLNNLLTAGNDPCDEPLFNGTRGIHVGSCLSTNARHTVGNAQGLMDLVTSIVTTKGAMAPKNHQSEQPL